MKVFKTRIQKAQREKGRREKSVVPSPESILEAGEIVEEFSRLRRRIY